MRTVLWMRVQEVYKEERGEIKQSTSPEDLCESREALVASWKWQPSLCPPSPPPRPAAKPLPLKSVCVHLHKRTAMPTQRPLPSFAVSFKRFRGKWFCNYRKHTQPPLSPKTGDADEHERRRTFCHYFLFISGYFVISAPKGWELLLTHVTQSMLIELKMH